MTQKFADVDAYLASLPETPRATLEAVRASIRRSVPEATESISYNLPTYKYKGRVLVYFGAAKNHCALYALDLSAFAAELEPFKTFGGTVQFAQEAPFPEDLLTRMLSVRLAAIEAATTKRRTKS